MTYKLALKVRAEKLRLKGRSVGEIAGVLGVSPSTASLWVRSVKLSGDAKVMLRDKAEAGRAKGREAILLGKMRQFEGAMMEFERWWAAGDRGDRMRWRFVAALLYWCEGGKTGSLVEFANSDPFLVRAFMGAMRRGFPLDESRWRALIHLHEYHDAKKQLAFWSRVTGIPPGQFNRPYLKPNAGKNRRPGYPGCLSVRYGDATIVRRLKAVYSAFAKTMAD